MVGPKKQDFSTAKSEKNPKEKIGGKISEIGFVKLCIVCNIKAKYIHIHFIQRTLIFFKKIRITQDHLYSIKFSLWNLNFGTME